jgi:hypothetical protein
MSKIPSRTGLLLAQSLGNSWLLNMAWIYFILLFPGYFFYQIGVSRGAIPPVLGGFFGVVSLSGTLLFLVAQTYMMATRPSWINRVDLVFFVLMSYVLFIALCNYVNGPMANNYRMLVWSLSGVLYNYVCFSVMRFLTFGGVGTGRMMWVIATAMAIVMYANSVDGRFYITEITDEENLATYQGYGRSLLVVFFMVFGLSGGAAGKVAISLIALPILFLNGGRTELALFIAAVSVYALWSSVTLAWHRWWRVLLIVPLGCAFWFLAPAWTTDGLPESRILEILDIGQSSSGVERARLTAAAVSSIAENPFLGDYGRYAISDWGVGSYSHNLLSAWVNLGLIGFLGYLTALGVALHAVFVSRESFGNRNSRQIVAFVLLVYVVLAFIVSRNYSDEFFGLALGLAAACLACHNLRRQASLGPSGLLRVSSTAVLAGHV